MRKEELLEIIKSMGLTAKEECSRLMVRTKDGTLVACVSEYLTYDMRLFEENIRDYSSVYIDILANALFEYAKTPIGIRNFLTKEEKQKIIFKSISDLSDEVNEINGSEGTMYKTITLNLSLDVIEEIREWASEN